MDRDRQQLIARFAALLFLAAAAPGGAPLLVREQAWTAPTHLRALTHSPGECLARTDAAIETGRALFRAPALLGGPAARAGLSCNACHGDGRANAHFLLPELTDRAGAADVTSEWASKLRGDGAMNPRDIPDLVDVSTRTQFGHAADPSLEHFVASVIEEEFQGQRPPEQAFAGVIAYLRALDGAACPAGDRAISLSTAADDVRRTLTAARMSDAPTARLVLLAAQDAVGRIVERLPARGFARDRRALEALSRDLGAMRTENVSAILVDGAPAWSARFDAVIARIGRRERRTYFNEATLRRALDQ